MAKESAISPENKGFSLGEAIGNLRSTDKRLRSFVLAVLFLATIAIMEGMLLTSVEGTGNKVLGYLGMTLTVAVALVMTFLYGVG